MAKEYSSSSNPVTISNKSTVPVSTGYSERLLHFKTRKNVSIDVDLGSESRAATKVISVRWKETDKELLEMETDTEAVRYREGELLFSEAWANQCLADKEKRPAVLVVTFDDRGKKRLC